MPDLQAYQPVQPPQEFLSTATQGCAMTPDPAWDFSHDSYNAGPLIYDPTDLEAFMSEPMCGALGYAPFDMSM